MLNPNVVASRVDDTSLPVHPALFEALLPLLAHEALDTDQVPSAGSIALDEMLSLFARPEVDRFVVDARTVTGDGELVLRSRDVGLRTENPLTSRLLPPVAADVPRALGAALRTIDIELRMRAGDAPSAAVHAWLGGQVLLTIHPFHDGNGRVARAFMASNLLRHVGPVPTALLATLLVHSAKGQRYHQAMWAFRAGSVEPLATLFLDAEAVARGYLAPTLRASSAPAGLMADCHAWLRTQLH